MDPTDTHLIGQQVSWKLSREQHIGFKSISKWHMKSFSSVLKSMLLNYVPSVMQVSCAVLSNSAYSPAKMSPKDVKYPLWNQASETEKAKLAQNTRITMSLMLPTIHVTLPLSFLFFPLSFCLRCCVNCFLLHQFLAHQLYSIDAFFIIWKHQCNSKYNGNYYYIRHFRNLKLLPHSVTKVSTISNNILLL